MPTPPKTTTAERAIAVSAIAVALLLLATTLAELLYAASPTPVAKVPSPVPALSRHVVLVVIDGLRYDYATDPDRAPFFARHMREDAHAEVWAGRVTMTSAAVLSMGTGQHGDFAQIVLNMNASRAKHNDLVSNVRAAGLKTALAGDEVWVQAFGDFDTQILDARGLSLETDNSPEIIEATRKLATTEPRPALLVAHLLAPDHQAHAYRADSEAYRAHLRRLDQSLGKVLEGLPGDTTVIAVSDHGALPNGQHGVDSKEERLTPMFAYGPGIRGGASPQALEQIDLGPTVATLLGVPAPTHGRGTPALELLDLPAAGQARVACADAERALAVAEAEGRSSFVERMRRDHPACWDPGADADAKRLAGHAVARAWDRHLDHAEASAGKKAMGAAFALFLGMFVLAVRRLSRARPLLEARLAFRFVLSACVVLALSVALTIVVDHTAPPWNESRAIVVAAAQLALYVAFVRPAAGARLYGRAPALSLLVMPGVLAWSFPMNARVHSFLALALGTTLWLLAPHADLLGTRALWLGRRALGRAQLAAAALGVAALFQYAFGPENDPLLPLQHQTPLVLGAGLVVLCVWLATFARARDGVVRPLDVALAIAIAAGGVYARRVVTAPLGVAGLVLLPAGALALARKGRATLAAGLAFGAYGLISRDEEILAVAAAALVAEAIGTSAGASAPQDEVAIERRAFAVGTLVLMLFATTFLARVGVQRGLDFTTMDWGAGGFHDPSPSQLRIGLCIGAKYVLPELLILWIFARALPRDLARAALLVSTLLWVGRSTSLALTLFLSKGGAYWTALRAMSDVGPALLMVVNCAAATLALSLVAARAEPSAVSEPEQLAA